MLTLQPFASAHNSHVQTDCGCLRCSAVVTVGVCLAVCPKLLFYTLIKMIGPWQPATVQLVERK